MPTLPDTLTLEPCDADIYIEPTQAGIDVTLVSYAACCWICEECRKENPDAQPEHFAGQPFELDAAAAAEFILAIPHPLTFTLAEREDGWEHVAAAMEALREANP